MPVRVIGPSVDNVLEFATQSAPPAPVRQQVDFDLPAYNAGGKVNLKLRAKASENDIEPTLLYAFYVPIEVVPALPDRTVDFFFNGSFANASIHAAEANADGQVSIQVGGVQPSATPYFIQTILEYPS